MKNTTKLLLEHHAKPVYKTPGIYFLCLGEEIVYVGKSVNVHARAFTHVDKTYDNVWFTPYALAELDSKESYWIHLVRPKYNIAKLNDRPHRPMTKTRSKFY